MSVWNDLRLAVRMLLRDRSFTLTASAALALGIAANSLVFTLVNGVLLRELPFHEPHRLMAIESRVDGQLERVVSRPARSAGLRAHVLRCRGC